MHAISRKARVDPSATRQGRDDASTMTGMIRGRWRRAASRRAPIAALCGAASVALLALVSACTGPGASAPDDTPSPSRSVMQLGEIPDASSALRVPPSQRGDCPVDPAQPGVITFVVTSDDDSTPVEVTYPVFRTDNTEQVRRMTQPGPVITVLQADCTDGVVDGPWAFVATADSGSLACALFYGGKLVASDSASGEGDATGGTESGVRADCTGHPGM